MLVVVSAIILLIAVNALYVAAEFAAVSARHSQIRRLAEQGNKPASKLLPWIEDSRKLDQYVAACQVGITISSLVLGAYSQAAMAVPLAPFFESWVGLHAVAAQTAAGIVVLTILTVIQVVLGELVPKSIALQFSTQTALLTYWPMRWSLTLFSGFIWVLNGSGTAILKLFGVPLSKHRHIHSPDELELLIAESRDGGVLEPDEHMRLHRALRLRTKSVNQLMVPRRYVASIDVNAPQGNLLREIADSPYSHIPVYQDSIDNIIGILHTKDVLIRFIEKGKVGSVRELMRPVMIMPETLTAESLLSSMRLQRNYQALLVDEYGGTEGVITLEDVLKEMLGEVADEFKADKPKPERLSTGRVRLPGLMRLDDVEPWIGTSWHGEADTVSGYVVESLGYVPPTGAQVAIGGMEVQVELVVNNAIESLIVKQIEPSKEDE
ncbi:MAG: hemolysin family protein [Pseudomonadota bacterium]